MANTITVACPNCGNEMRAAVKHIGRKGRCAECGHLVTISPSESADRSVYTLDDADAERDTKTVSGTEVNHLLAGLIGLAATVLLYAVFYLMANAGSYLGVFMTQRSVLQHLITLVTCWGLAILVLKYMAVQRELRRAERELDLIPLEVGLQITAANVDQFLEHLRKLPPDEQDGILARRLRGALEHFKHRNNVSEVQSYLATQADIEASAVDSGYTVLRVFIWVCPILGFIGTVLGIGWAVTDLAQAIPTASAGDAAGGAAGLGDQLMDGMRLVTQGLATAFDTTLLGLICVVILMFPTEGLKKTEYGMLDRVQGFANESLLRRMTEDAHAGEDHMPRVVREALDSAFKEHQRWLAQWQAQVGKLGNTIGADFEEHARGVQERMAQAEGERVKGVDSAVRRVEELFAQFDHLTKSWHGSVGGELQGAISSSAQLHQSLDRNTAALQQVLGKQAELADRYARSDLAGVLQSLHDAIARLAGDRPTPPRDELVPVLPPVSALDVTQPSDGRGGPRKGFIGRLFGGDGNDPGPR